MKNNTYETFDPIVIDDFVPSWYQDAIQTMFANTDFKYSVATNHYRDLSIPIIGYPKKIIDAKSSDGFANMTYIDGKPTNQADHAVLLPMLYRLTELIGPFELVRTRLAMNFSDGVGGLHQQHVDQNGPHVVLLYYVEDSDGDTVLYNERYNPDYDLWETYPKSFTVNTYVEPKRGRAVIFDGLQYHSSSSPLHNRRRSIINIDVMRPQDSAWWQNRSLQSMAPPL